MIISLFLHIVFCALSVWFAHLGIKQIQNAKSQKKNINILISFLLLFLFIGLRYNLGRDWVNYERIFNDPNQQEFLFGETREFGFLALIQFCHALGLGFQAFVMIITFITLGLLYKSYNHYIYLLPAGIFIFFTDLGYASIINLLRQTLALLAFVCAMSYAGMTDKKSLLRFFSFYFLGVSFHYTILVFLPFWFINRLHLSRRQLIILCISIFLISVLYLARLYEDFMSLIPKYDNAYTNTSSTIVNEQSTFGLGATLLLVVRLIPLAYYNIMLKWDKGMAKYFIMYYLGLSVYYGFYNYLLITRFTFYFQIFELVILPYVIYKASSMKGLVFRLMPVVMVILLSFNFIYLYSDFINDHVVTRTFSLLFVDFIKEPHLL